MSFSGGPVHTKRAPRKQALQLLVCGASGTGKSAFINTFVGHKVLYASELSQEASGPLHFETSSVELDGELSDGARLVLTLVETQNFGTSLDHEGDVDAVAKFIENRFDEVLAEESRIRRNPRFKDNRIDACIYFIEPTGHGLREIDVLTLRRLSSIVNIIPVLARADTMTPSEVVMNKRLVTEDMRFHDLEVFPFQYTDDNGIITSESDVFNALPLAITSTSEFDEHGRSQYVRKLAYGEVNVLDAAQTDFKLLRDALIDAFLIELKDRTHDVLYENFRTQRLDPKAQHRQSMLMPQQLADHAARLKQAQIDRETALLREEERRVNAEIEAKRALLLKRERELRVLDRKLADSPSLSNGSFSNGVANGTIANGTIANGTIANGTIANGTNGVANGTNFANGTDGVANGTNGIANGTNGHTANGYDSHIGYVDTVDGDDMHAGGMSPGSDLESLASVPASPPAQRLKHKQSQKELRDHADQLHQELGDLELQRRSIQDQITSPLRIKKP